MGLQRNLTVASIITLTAMGSDNMARENKSERPKAPYKLLYNNDTTNTAGPESPFHKRGEPFTEAKLVASIEEVAGKGVDGYLLSPGMGWVPWWQSEVEPDFFEWWQKRTGLEVVEVPDPSSPSGFRLVTNAEPWASRGYAAVDWG